MEAFFLKVGIVVNTVGDGEMLTRAACAPVSRWGAQVAQGALGSHKGATGYFMFSKEMQ